MPTASRSALGRLLPVSLAALVVALLLASCAVPVRVMNGGMARTSVRMPGRHAPVRCPQPVPTAKGAVVHVHLMDMRGMMRGATMRLMAAPAVVRHGRVTFVAADLGRRTHELVILPLHGRAAGRRHSNVEGRISERGALGEASSPCAAGAGDGLEPGTTGWVTLRLRPGRYELVCNEPHHYARGMHALLVVR